MNLKRDTSCYSERVYYGKEQKGWIKEYDTYAAHVTVIPPASEDMTYEETVDRFTIIYKYSEFL
ncbi:hypothetical protein [Metabacillus sediminilitoris]|uniref:hypothetical protein n=1 Tax=Metabacillus sediminilitoris TaxID=2567941 RepID=UPI001454D274|nr:hypothetical protein [Metabacillus sediminilitoris]